MDPCHDTQFLQTCVPDLGDALELIFIVAVTVLRKIKFSQA